MRSLSPLPITRIKPTSRYKLDNFRFIPSINNEQIFIEVTRIPKFIFRGEEFIPNMEISRLFYMFIYFENYVLLYDIVKKNKIKFKSIDVNICNWLIRKDFLSQVSFLNFLIWVDMEIFQLESGSFQYNLNILVQRYFTEHSIKCDMNLVFDLTRILQSIKYVDSNLLYKVNKKIFIKKEKEFIVEKIYKLLHCANKPLKTLDILSQTYNLDDREKILILLRRNSIFQSFGLGYWGLKEWDVQNIYNGSIRDIVYKHLEVSENPIHISVILDSIRAVRDISIESLMSNLRSDPYKKYYFFQCGFVGLKHKNYNEYWHTIPKFIPVYFYNLYNKNKTSLSLKEIYELVERKYNYPIIHLQFIFDNKVGLFSN